MWSQIAPFIGTGGAAGIVVALAYFAYRMHKDAVDAQKERADDWKTAAQAAQARADLKDQQMGILLSPVKDPLP